jgi:phasin family protein
MRHSQGRAIQNGENTRMTIKPKLTEVGTPTESASSAEAAVSQAIDATMSSLKDGVAQATAEAQTTPTRVKEGMEKVMKTAEEFVTFSQGNVEAVVKSSQIWATGMQDLSKHIAASAQASFDQTMSTFKAFTSVKSLKDAFELQSAFARSTLEKTMAESGKLTDASYKLTEQALAPITARVSLAVEKFAKVA